MEDVITKKEGVDQKLKRFEERLRNRFTIEDSSVLGNQMKYSNLFEKDNESSSDYTILKINFERATLREASSFKKFMEKVIAEDGKSLVVNLNECEFVDSSFFGVLVGGVKRMKAMDKKFYLIYDSHNRLPIFSATGLDKVFKVYSSVEEAIA
jgi:anti-sigma B factor antagonist